MKIGTKVIPGKHYMEGNRDHDSQLQRFPGTRSSVTVCRGNGCILARVVVNLRDSGVHHFSSIAT